MGVRTAARRHGGSAFWATAAVFALLTLAVFVALLLDLGGPRPSDALDDIAELVAALLASAFCAVTAYKVKEARARWTLLSLSALAWGGGEAAWTYYDLVKGVTVPFPGWPDVGFLASVPLAVAGLLAFPGGPQQRGIVRLESVLDATLVGGSLLFASWVTILEPIYHAQAGHSLGQVISLAYPVSDVVIASIVVVLLTRPWTRNRGAVALVMAGMLAFAVADSSFSYLTEVNNYGIGNALDVGWIAGYLLMALGAMRVLTNRQEPRAGELHLTLQRVLAPYVPFVLAGAAFLWEEIANKPLRRISEFMAFGLVAVMASRQLLVLLENLSLTRQLEARVEQRTAELRHQALHDRLTGLANRALFNEQLAAAVRRRSRSGAALAVLFIDLDGFKQVNDLYGHEVGDRALRSVARRFSSTLREADTLARLGGDEFAALLEGDPGASDPGRVARRLLDSLARPIRIGSLRLALQASVGIADDDGAESAEELRRNADLAMYTAKSAGRHSYEIYAPEMHSEILERMRMAVELRAALDNEEFVLHFQPIVGLSSGVVEGVEALVRWDHPRRGLLGPGEFIPAAEATGLIVPIGAWVLHNACAEMQAIAEGGGASAFGLSVNLSAGQLGDDHLVDTVAGALASSGFDPHRLTLEVTESMLMEDLDAVVVVVERLRELGLNIAIDDFGTGYSSLSVLRTLPVDILKIDRSFVTGIASDEESAALAQRIVELAGDFKLHTVAEGVEQAEQLEVLRDLGCDAVQGNLFYRPLAGAALREALGRRPGTLRALEKQTPRVAPHDPPAGLAG